VDVAEIHAPFTHQELILRDALALAPGVRVNPSGGALAANLKKYVTAYAKGLPGSAAFRERVLHANDAGVMVDLTREFFTGRAEAA
jgi:2-keto-3-deoxy-6-phosphogluconate aldolase